jgi:peptidoglycan/xylan/chitin deacetylase (PgdA/CDA1 family)
MFRLDRFLTLYFFYPLVKRSRPHAGIRISILMYHSISNDPEDGVRPYYRVNTSPIRFAQHMRWLSDHNYRIIPLTEAVRLLNPPINHLPDQPRYVVLTFDDGFHDFLKHAWPILQHDKRTATVFLPTAFIGTARKSFKHRECLTWPEVRGLHRQGVLFGSHTASHPKLYSMPWKEIQLELRESRLAIENALQAPAHCFAYPYAFPQEDKQFVQRFAKELVDQGYRCAVTTVIGRAGPKSHPLHLERLPVNGADDESLFKAKLAGAYDWVVHPQAFARRLKSRLSAMRPAQA